MVCATCGYAADNYLGAEEHCNADGGPGAACCCQHRVERGGQSPAADTTTED